MAMATVMMALLLATCASASCPRPSHWDPAAKARWLVSKNDWGMLSTISVHLNGVPWGNIASYSDGPVYNSTGTPYFYLSKLDPTPQDIDKNSSCSFTLSEVPLGTCGRRDPENPNCARLTLSGELTNVTDAREHEFAKCALFSKHPQMPKWPQGGEHGFTFYKLDIQDLFLLDGYGGPENLNVSEYYHRGSAQTAVDH